MIGIFPSDIPAPWWLRLPIYLLRFFRKTSLGRYFAFHFRNRLDLFLFAELHQKAIHDIRSLTTAQLTLAENKELAYEHFERVADSCRDVMANTLEVSPEQLHATIKIFAEDDCHEAIIGPNDGGGMNAEEHEKLIDRIGELKVYTLARSTDSSNYWSGRPFDVGSNHFHLVRENSSFASILGVKDKYNDWRRKACNCFVENRLTELAKLEKYANSGVYWQDHYLAAAVFPIRYTHHVTRQPIVVGFLTFDAKHAVFGAFGAYPDIFNFADPIKYRDALWSKTFFHVGGILADTLMPGLLQYHRNRGSNLDSI
ncbi:hypothetical protein [Marichromatium purpuratum]|uniref:hypothetical protein n=1 Tax=Marichromatium purpuratum TaxID=37487 RepID=UPI00021E6D02|nr:hypothetical protein [Marichromatium purpuratum]